jgi:hypothetical protein
MANLMDLLQSQLSDGLLDTLSDQLGGADKEQTSKAATGIFSTLMGAMAKNASTPEGASSLANALDKDHDGGLLDNVMDMFGGNTQPQQARAANGTGILKHVLGGKQSGAVDMISKLSGLDSGKTGSLMTMLAPIVMGSLGKAKKEQGFDVSSLTSFLGNSVKSTSNQNAEMGLISKFIDQDGDGSIMDDLAGMGMNMLGSFFKKK